MLQINTARFNFEDLYTIFGASSLFNMDTSFEATGVSTDTRSVSKGNIFVALKGENFDGHEFLAEAVSKGAKCLLIDQEVLESDIELPDDVAIITARDTLTALGVLGRYHRDKFDLPVIAVAGSNGKTSTKDLIAHFLSPKFEVLKTEKNYNNKIGVPLTLLKLSGSHTACVLEIGTNEFGEIGYLSEISNPTHGLITNIGAEHLEHFEDLDGVELEEAMLFGWLRQQGGHGFVNIDDPRLEKYFEALEHKTAYSYSGNEAHFSGTIIPTDDGSRIEIKCDDTGDFNYNLAVKGKIAGINSIAAASVAIKLGVSADQLAEISSQYQLQEYEEGYGRMAIIEKNGDLILNDTYNANADSTLLALDILSETAGKDRKKVAVLGDMRELGDSSLSEHKRVIERAKEVADIIYLYGAEYQAAHIAAGEDDRLYWFSDKNNLKAALAKLEGKKALLYKGSRGMKMEDLLK